MARQVEKVLTPDVHDHAMALMANARHCDSDGSYDDLLGVKAIGPVKDGPYEVFQVLDRDVVLVYPYWRPRSK